MRFPYKKVLIIGCGGAGKSTFARAMSQKLGLPVVHLDRIWWLPNWQTLKKETFDEILKTELKKSTWIIDGNFMRTLPMRMEHADLCLFFDFETRVCLSGAYERSKNYNGKSRPDITEGCIEEVHPDFIDWIMNYKKDVRPEVVKILDKNKVKYKIFSSRDEAYTWLDMYEINKNL